MQIKELTDYLNSLSFEDSIPEHNRKNPLSLAETVDMCGTGSYGIQYNHIYLDRFQKLSERFEELHPFQISKIEGTCMVSGIIKKKYKVLQKKLGSKKSAISMDIEEYVEPFIIYGEDDLVEIEDESGKIEIAFSETTKIHYNSQGTNLIKPSYKLVDLPFGVVVAIRGYLDPIIGKFVCQDIFFPSIPLPPTLNMSIEAEDSKIIIASDLNKHTYQKLISILKEDYTLRPQIQALILCGTLYDDQTLTPQGRYQHLDEYLQQLRHYVSIAVVSDFKSSEWPHKPLPTFFLKKSSKSVLRCHNPSIIKVESCILLISNGENVTESMRVHPLTNPIDIMDSHLVYNHIAPYAPSTFKSVPLGKDVFALDALPSVYVVSGQNQYDTKLFHNSRGTCRMVLVPSFEAGIVEINIKTLEAKKVIFQE